MENNKAALRDSNIELLRIVMMLAIIAHHYVVNSGISPLIFNGGGGNGLLGNKLFALCFGFGGKTAINAFVLITGFFMCKKEFHWTKVVNLFCLMVFYRWFIYALFIFSGYEAFSVSELAKTILFIPRDFGHGFASSFLGLYLLVPFLNKALQNFGKKDLQGLILTLLSLFTLLPTFFYNTAYEYIGWYVTVYLVGAYLRLYPPMFLEDTRKCLWLSGVSLALCYASVVAISLAGTLLHKTLPVYWFVSDSNKVLAILASVSFFCLFKSLKIGHIKLINTLAASTFGILLIHASSDTMRNWLWNDVMHAADAYSQRLFPLYAFGAVLSVYLTCFVLDFARKQLLNKVFLVLKRTPRT